MWHEEGNLAHVCMQVAMSLLKGVSPVFST